MVIVIQSDKEKLQYFVRHYFGIYCYYGYTTCCAKTKWCAPSGVHQVGALSGVH